ncbi:hypothetical protein MMC29_008153, partial [Sticta canariensis]|nr:hypothetical protein [Sticta canariensis]
PGGLTDPLVALTSPILSMPPDKAAAGQSSAPQELPPPQPRHLATRNHLKRSPAPLSVRLRSKPFKRLKLSSKTDDDAKVQPLTTRSRSVAGRVFGPTETLRSKPNPSESVRRAKAEEWFNDNNKNVSRAQNTAFPDGRSCRSVTVPCGAKILADDPPFYLHQQPSSDIDSACAVLSDQAAESSREPNPPLRMTRSTLSRMESRESTSEEFRSVIDDLTVENKKLKQKLKKYEELHCSHLQEDKLFEVRIHRLPAHKKCELEKTLRSFASSLGESPDAETFAAAPAQTSLVPGPLLPAGHKLFSLSTACCKRVDSAYASISATGQTMISQSTRNDGKSVEKQACSAESKRQEIKSYLHDVPQGAPPRKSPVMSKKARRKIVVRRLEELFTGKGAATQGSNQSLQQQEVSQSANSEAGARRWESKCVREARILPVGAEFTLDPTHDEDTTSQPRDGHGGNDSKSHGTAASGGGTPEQRPTHPLDLDLYRAQIPADNMQYIRHLGLASPMMNSDPASDQQDGWVYLNLLTSMAQLHSFNVTTQFVRKSVADFSSKLELSADGRKIRWKGGTEGTRMSSDGESSPGDDGLTGSRRRHHERGTDRSDVNISQLSNYNSSTDFGAGERRRPKYSGQFNRASNFHYKPLFFRGARSEDGEDDSVRDRDSLTSYNATDEMSGADSNSRDPRGSKVHSTSFRRQRENGPIIFYSHAKFCTDLSGDPRGTTRTDKISFTRFTDELIGREMIKSLDRMGLEGPEGGLINRSDRADSVKADGNVSSIMDSHLTTDQPETSGSADICEILEPIYLEASGLGGVQPQDNLLIDVHVQHRKKNCVFNKARLPPLHGHVRRIQYISRPKINILQNCGLPSSAESTESLVEANIISSRVTVLPPSMLPDPSYLCLPFSSDNEDDDDDSKTSEDESRPKPSPVSSVEEPLADEDVRGILLASDDEASQESSFVTTSEGSDDSSIDLLAHARVLDPDTIAAREREFDCNVGQPLAELPAGSSAATAGGGSGFPSEGSNSSLTMDEGRTRVKRRRTHVDRASRDVRASSREDDESR